MTTPADDVVYLGGNVPQRIVRRSLVDYSHLNAKGELVRGPSFTVLVVDGPIAPARLPARKPKGRA